MKTKKAKKVNLNTCSPQSFFKAMMAELASLEARPTKTACDCELAARGHDWTCPMFAREGC